MNTPDYSSGNTVHRVIEECAELIHAICKADRFGWYNFHPDHPEKTNINAIREEIEDVLRVVTALKQFIEP